MTPDVGRLLVVIGLLIAAVGALAAVGLRLPFGRLPGDIAIVGEHGALVIPIATCVVLSIVLTVIANLVLRR